MDVIPAVLSLVAALFVGYVGGRTRRLHELKYQRRMAEHWYCAYRRERLRKSEDPADFWKD